MSVADLSAARKPRVFDAGSFDWSAFDYYPRLRRVRDHFVEHISRPLNTAAAARLAGLNASYFSTFFRARVGARYTDWARYMRVEQAMRILRREDRAIRDVARAVGYRGIRSFERAFKRQTGTTPSAFKRRVRPGPRPSQAVRRVTLSR